MKDKKKKEKQGKDKKNKDKKNKHKKSKDKNKKRKNASKKELGKKKDKSQRTKTKAEHAPAPLTDDAFVSQPTTPAPPRSGANIPSSDDNAAASATDRAPKESASGKKPHYHVFLSHNSRDKPAVEPLAVMLRQKGLNPFLDKWNLIPGQPVEEALVQALEHSDSAVIFVGPDGDGPWQSEEMRDILKRAVKSQNEFRAIPVLLPGASAAALEKSFLGSRLWIEFKDVDDDDALLRLAKAVQGEAYGDESFKLPDEPAPYRGLERFERIENPEEDFFFGRDDEIRALVDRLVKDRFVAVVGASGSGKSSLIRAGLTKQLAEDIHPGIRRWQTLIVEPGSRPFRSLAVQVAVAAGIPAAERESWIEERVEKWSEAPDGVRTSIESLFADAPEPLLVFIDQFEELFTHRKEGEKHEQIARNFVANLADLWKNAGDRVRVILSLRADFVERCLEIGPLKELLQDRTMLVGEVGDDALREIVKEPAARVGAFLEKGLMERILTEVHSQSGSLPLLQQALHELWKHRKGAWLTHEAFDASGGVARALNDQAQAAYKSLDDQQRKIADRLFPRLITLGEGVSDTRRRVKRKELYPEGVAPAAVNEVIDKLSSKDARILVTSREGGDSEDLAAGEDFVEFTHEALLENWQHLVTLLDSERASIRKHRALTTMAQEWEAKPQDERHKFLLRAGQLVIAEQWASDEGGYEQLNQLERHFLNDSIQQRNAEEAHQAKIARRLKMLSIGATAAAVVAFAVSLYAFDQQGKAEAARDDAEKAFIQAETNRSMARELMSDFVPELTKQESFAGTYKTMLADASMVYFDQFVVKRADKPETTAIRADAKYAIGRIGLEMGEFGEAINALEEARDLQLKALEIDGDKLESLSISVKNETLAKDLGYTLNALGHAYRENGDYVKAKPLYRSAMEVREKLRGPGANNEILYASAVMNIGLAEKSLEDFESARMHFNCANKIRETLLKTTVDKTDKVAIQRNLALGKLNLAVMLDEQQGTAASPSTGEDSAQQEGPEGLVNDAIERYEEVLKSNLLSENETFAVQAELANCFALRGRLNKERNQMTAIDDYTRAVAIYHDELFDKRSWIVKYQDLLKDGCLDLIDLCESETSTEIGTLQDHIRKVDYAKLIRDSENSKLLLAFIESSLLCVQNSVDHKEGDDARIQFNDHLQQLTEFYNTLLAKSSNRKLAEEYCAALQSLGSDTDLDTLEAELNAAWVLYDKFFEQSDPQDEGSLEEKNTEK